MPGRDRLEDVDDVVRRLTIDGREVQVQRVRERLESARSVLRALAASPRCLELTAELATWDGRPSARWRKRLSRHVRECPQCLVNTSDLIPAEGLLGGLALVPVPIGLAGLVLAKLGPAGSATAGGAAAHGPGGAGRVSRSLRKLAAKPVAAVTAGAVVLAGGGVAWYTSGGSEAPAREPAAVAPAPAAASSAPPTPEATPPPTPTPTAATPLSGRHALRSVDVPGRYVSESGALGALLPVGSNSSASVREGATFTFVAGLADSRCYSLVDAAGRYVRHYAFRIRLAANDGSDIFQKDATFCARSGSADGSVSLESYNYPGRYLRHRDNLELWLDPAEDTAAYRAGRSFVVVAPW
ncbi:AbfB domain-containing protein [Streptomyces sp. NPDC093544]|uniref:AbfB domain-containing protein n=1 Tax=Streptomyces sp. NPDC093544 TaxID=3155200 RepID=UPI00341EDE94